MRSMKMIKKGRLVRLSLVVPFAAALLSTGCTKASAECFPLVNGGKAAPIVIPAEAEASTELAAKELADYVEKVSGVRPALATNDYAQTPRVEIGTLNTMKGLPDSLVKRFDASDSWESHVVTCTKDVLRIVGRDEVAELYGVYQFLEEKLGVRWFKQWMPEDDGEYVPSSPNLMIGAYEKFRAPFFRFRSLSQTGSSTGYVPVRGIEWTVRLGLQTDPYRDKAALAKRHLDKKADAKVHGLHWKTMKPRVQLRSLCLGGGHMMFHDAVKSNQYFAAHPEYFALVNGRRQDKDSRRCMSNPEVQRIVADDILRRFDTFGGKGYYLFGLMDGRNGTCECDACHALDSAEERKRPLNDAISTRFHTCAKKMADMVYAKRPDATLVNWAYSNYNMPPEGVKLDPRTGAELCIHGRCYGHPLNDPNCERNPKKLAWLRKWLKSASWVKLYEYAHCSGCSYGCYETIIGEDLRFYKQIGVKGWHEEMHYADSVHVPVIPKDQFDKRREYTLSKWQWLYLAGKLTWDPDQDDAAILADAESKYYGAAYPEMRRYQAIRRKLWRNGPVCFAYGGYPMTDERTRTLMSIPGAKETLLGCLDRAEKLVQDDPKRLYRVRQDRTWLQRYWIEPNEKLRKSSNPTLRAVETPKAPAVDGSAGDACWTSAKWIEDATPDRVSAAVVTDYRKLYFLFRVSGNADMMKTDRLGVILYAPDADNTGKSHEFTCDLKRFAKGQGGGYSAELAVDTSAIRPLRRGEIWRVRFFRNPDGNEPDIRYPLEIGEPKLSNGSFECLKEDGTPKSWDHLTTADVVTYDGNQHAIKVDDYFMQGLSGLRSFGTAPVDRKVRVSFRAWGAGKLNGWFTRYLDTPKPGGGYTRTTPHPGVDICAVDVTEKPRYYEFVVTIPAKEWMSLYFRRGYEKKRKPGDLFIDDVSVTDEELGGK